MRFLTYLLRYENRIRITHQNKREGHNALPFIFSYIF